MIFFGVSHCLAHQCCQRKKALSDFFCKGNNGFLTVLQSLENSLNLNSVVTFHSYFYYDFKGAFEILLNVVTT